MLIDSQRILTFHGDTLDDAVAMLRRQIDELPLTARIASLTSGCEASVFSGLAVVELIPEVESTEPGPSASQDAIVTPLPVGGDLPDEL